jgi:SAM-dependent methyltransferase
MDSKLRFSNRVENYVKYRPGYPTGVIATLVDSAALASHSVVADIGSGTGLFARLFLELGCRVIGLEPNLEMREAGERILASFPNFISLAGSAEATGLEASSVDFVTAGQAFHWFDRPRARLEFARILKPGGWVVLAWNERRLDSTPFLEAYEALLLQFGTDYTTVNHLNVENDPSAIPDFFGGPFREARFDNLQRFDFEGVKGRLLSSSYVPDPTHPLHAPMLTALRQIFDQYQSGGTVDFEYDTHLFWGHLTQ